LSCRAEAKSDYASARLLVKQAAIEFLFSAFSAKAQRSLRFKVFSARYIIQEKATVSPSAAVVLVLGVRNGNDSSRN